MIRLNILINGMLFCYSGVCSGVVCHINGGAVTSIACADVQSAEDC